MAKHPGIPPTLRDGRLEEEVIITFFIQSIEVFLRLHVWYTEVPGITGQVGAVAEAYTTATATLQFAAMLDP